MIAVGRVAERALREINVSTRYVRHPARGGQRAFQAALTMLLARS